MAKMYRINDWNENEKFSLRKIAQDVIRNNANKNNIQTSCCIDTTKSECAVNTSCCIDTTKIHDPHMNSVQGSCCIDTTRE
ncbi:MAG: hypothetical protein IJ287_04245 [Methanobrevibacter sp.]|nr:hypothetical protein [Methanobrevibacter sp.]